MKGQFTRGLASGMLLGTAACLMMIPQLDFRTRRRFDRSGRKLASRAGNIICDIKDCMR
jgi:hypothetical protein